MNIFSSVTQKLRENIDNFKNRNNPNGSVSQGLFTDQERQDLDQQAKNGDLKYDELKATQAVAGRTKCQDCMGQCPGCKNSALEKFRESTNSPFGKLDPNQIKLTVEENKLMILAASGDLQALQKLQESMQHKTNPEQDLKPKETLKILDQMPNKEESPQIVKPTEIRIDEAALLARKAQEDLLLREFIKRKEDEQRETEKSKNSKAETVVGDKHLEQPKKGEQVSFYLPVEVKSQSALVTKREDPDLSNRTAKTSPTPTKATRSSPRSSQRNSRSPTRSSKAALRTSKQQIRTSRSHSKPQIRTSRSLTKNIRSSHSERISRLKPPRELRATRDTKSKQLSNLQRDVKISTKAQNERITRPSRHEKIKQPRKSEARELIQQNDQDKRVKTLRAEPKPITSQVTDSRRERQIQQDIAIRQNRPKTEQLVLRKEPERLERRILIQRTPAELLTKAPEKTAHERLRRVPVEIKKATEQVGGLKPKRLDPQIIRQLLTVSSKYEIREIVKAIKSLSPETQVILSRIESKHALKDLLKILATKNDTAEIKDLLKFKPTQTLSRQIQDLIRDLPKQAQQIIRIVRDELAREILMLIDQEADRKKKDALTKAIKKLLEESNDLEKLIISLKALSELRAKIKFKAPDKVEEKIVKDQEERSKQNETESADEVEVKKGSKFKQQGPSKTLDIFQAQVDDGDTKIERATH